MTQTPTKAVVLLSGGLDSATTVAMAQKSVLMFMPSLFATGSDMKLKSKLRIESLNHLVSISTSSQRLICGCLVDPR